MGNSAHSDRWPEHWATSRGSRTHTKITRGVRTISLERLNEILRRRDPLQETRDPLQSRDFDGGGEG